MHRKPRISEPGPDTPLTGLFVIPEQKKRILASLGLIRAGDLLFYFPARYQNFSGITAIRDLAPGAVAAVYGRISRIATGKAYRKNIPLSEAILRDGTGAIKIVWFHQPYIARMVREGDFVKVEGKAAIRNGKLYMANPGIEPADAATAEVPGASLFAKDAGVDERDSLSPVYPERKYLSSRWFAHHIERLLRLGIVELLPDPIPQEILARYNLPKLRTALIWMHAPRRQADADAARKRFAFQEIFLIQLARQKDKRAYREHRSFPVSGSSEAITSFLKRFPFKSTAAQTRAIEHIMSDLSKDEPMMRLLEGDVGSGKTLVAAATAYATIETPPRGERFGRLQVAYMAPTEILAQQHFESFSNYFAHLEISIGLLTGSGCRKFPSKVGPKRDTPISRAQLLHWVEDGTIPIVIGTHALIQKSVRFKNLAYVIIDEQHRFGVVQRMKLARKEARVPHLLSMTATPIPRTLALTMYGDLDLTLLDEMPAGRKPVITHIVDPSERKKMYGEMRRELTAGRQAYVICPRIDEPDPAKKLTLYAKSVKEEARRLKREEFADVEIGILHSKMKPKDKEEVMRRFAEGTTKILVATSVVEVGVNIPNATVIAIEGTERFGLAQLHQLRGRVLRSNSQAYCFAIVERTGKAASARLHAFAEATNGFELAELDLKLRGPGELSGAKQWGISDIGMEAIKNLKMVEAARAEARDLLANDPALEQYPLLTEHLLQKTAATHFE